MGYVDAPIESIWTTEDDIVAVQFQGGCDITYTLKPYQIHKPFAVGEVSYQPCLAPLSHLLYAQYASSYLHKRHVGSQFADAV